MGVIAGYPEHRGHLGDLEAVPELVDDIPLTVVEAADGGADQLARLGPLGLAADELAFPSPRWVVSGHDNAADPETGGVGSVRDA